MTEKPETCQTCNRYTISGLQQLSLQHRARPLTGIDLTRPLEFVLADIGREMVAVRSKLNDVSLGFTGWAEQVKDIEGLLTCGLIAMHHLQEQAKEHRQLWEKRHVGLSAEEMKAQAERCGCRGSDELCACQNEPDDKTIEARELTSSHPPAAS